LTDEQLIELLKMATRDVIKTDKPYELVIGGYDDNPIPLWAIEAIPKFAKRLVDLGFLSVLKMIPDLKAREVSRGWTAYELWLCSKNELGPDMDLHRMLKDCKSDFDNDVMLANDKCDKMVGRK